MTDEKNNEEKIFWHTIPGILTGIAALIGAVGALLIVLSQIGVIGSKLPQPPLIDNTIPCKNANKITIFSLKSINDQRGINIINVLSNSGCNAAGVLLITEAEQIGYPDLRYFHKIDFEEAKVIKDHIKQKTGIDLILKYIPEYADKSPKGEFEIWLN